MIHATYGIYPNGEWKRNAVAPEDLVAHIDYNRTFRPGRALVVDGAIQYEGFVNPELLQKVVSGLPEWHPEVVSRPYV